MTLVQIVLDLGDMVLPWRKKPYVLVVEDSPGDVDMIVRAAEAEEIEVKIAHSAEEAFGVLRENPRVAFILVDVGLPGQNGWEFRKMIGDLYPKIRVCVMSGSLDRLNGLPIGESICVMVKGPSYGNFFRQSKQWRKI